MGNFACCVERTRAGDFEGLPGVQDISVDDSEDLQSWDEELEWSIVADAISADDLQKVRQLRAALQDCDTHPACQRSPMNRQPQTLLRFLRGREGNVEKAATMFRDHLDWRESFGVEEKTAEWVAELRIGESSEAKLAKRYGTEVDAFQDRWGIPVRLTRLSVSDVHGIVREIGSDVVLVDSLARMERLHRALRAAMFRHRKLINGQIQIIDVGDYGMPKWSSRMWGAFRTAPEIFKVFDLNYPETARCVFIVRVNNFARNIWRMALPLVPQRTQKKLKLFGQNASEWIEDIREHVSEDVELPGFLERDDAQAFAEATPQGGFVPEGILEELNLMRGSMSPKSAAVVTHRRSSKLKVQLEAQKKRLLPCSVWVLATAVTVTAASLAVSGLNNAAPT